ncbi:DUF2268 domain-containing putative Zn-dependent protease [Pseudoduganella sp. GCM10020061]|uniref:DUF2268 domain-containing putative Zn-dependent protease n=1 Tax=Pseudoduganella sp. GCM10020061 TaxID=3317345 RepID=UPI00362DD401
MNRLLRCALPLAAAFLVSTTAFGAGKPAAPQPGYRVINLMPAFWEFYGKTQGLAPEAQAVLFNRMVARRYPEVYAADVVGIRNGKPLDDEIVRRYKMVQERIGSQMDVMRDVSNRISKDLTRYETTFRKSFPDLAYSGDIYFMYSLGGFDGGVRNIKGNSALLFGLDMITWVYGKGANPEPFFHHELFHIYHRQFKHKDQPEGILGALWGEGLATYVAQALNPGTGGVEIFGLPRNTPERVLADVPGLAKNLRALLDSKSSDDYRRYFLGLDEKAEVPSRSGYVMGYLVAKKLAKRHTLQELAHTPLSELRPEIEQALAELEAGEKVTLD